MEKMDGSWTIAGTLASYWSSMWWIYAGDRLYCRLIRPDPAPHSQEQSSCNTILTTMRRLSNVKLATLHAHIHTHAKP